MNKFIVLALVTVCACAQINNHRSTFSRIYNNVGDVTFTPHPLPCAFEITAMETETDSDGSVLSEDNSLFARHGDYFRYFGWYKSKEVTKTTDELYRFDLKIEENETVYVTYFSAEKGEHDGCSFDWLEQEDAEESVNGTLEWFIRSIECDRIEQTTYKGKKCNVCICEKDTTRIYFSIDKYVLAMEEIHNEGKDSISFEYKFYSPLDTYAISKNVSTECREEAYNPPTQKMCAEPSYSSSSTGSNPHSHSQSSMAWIAQTSSSMLLLSIIIMLLLTVSSYF